MQTIITLDFETKPIQSRPNYPPEPVGVAIKYGEAPAKYLAWGHATGQNNTTEKQAREELEAVLDVGGPLLFHNAYFDLSVLVEYFGFDLPHWSRIHDTALQAFLVDPHGARHDLKGLAEEHLRWAPEERDRIGEWVWEHRFDIRKIYGLNPTRSGGKVSKVWQYYWIVPGDLAGDYAIGDVDRTYALHQLFFPDIAAMGMLNAYNREREVAPIFYQNEREGIRVDVDRLEEDVATYSDLVEYVEGALRERLGDSGLNFDKDVDVAEALSRNGIVKDEDWSPTDTGAKWLAKNPGKTVVDMPRKYRSMSKQVLKKQHYQDFEVFCVLGYRNRLQTSLKMFMRPWLEQAQATGGRIHTHWNTTRGQDGGTRTGRPSTYSPNFLNISNNFENRTDGYEHPAFLLGEGQRLPLVREYVLADDDDSVILHRDFSGQELRVFAHYESGELLTAYKQNPHLDVHQMVADKIAELFPDAPLDRGRTKIINFQSLYGGGAPALANELDVSLEEARTFKAYHNVALPGRVTLVDTIKRIVGRGNPIRTWGGRCYLPEKPRRIDGKMRSFEYKLINHLIQGSAADITKECMIRWWNHPDRKGRFLMQVYDELNIVVRKEDAARQMAVLKEVMEGIELDVQMLSDGKYGVSWGKLTKGDPEEIEL